jgi:hypothetical protein
MTTDTAAQLDLVRRQRDHAEVELHRLRGMLTEEHGHVERLLTALREANRELEQIEQQLSRTAAPEPGYVQIAAAIDDALKTADLRIELKTGTGSDWGRFTDSYDRELYVLAKTLDKAGLIDWNAFTDTGDRQSLTAGHP